MESILVMWVVCQNNYFPLQRLTDVLTHEQQQRLYHEAKQQKIELRIKGSSPST